MNREKVGKYENRRDVFIVGGRVGIDTYLDKWIPTGFAPVECGGV